jgi:hypothetical protein
MRANIAMGTVAAACLLAGCVRAPGATSSVLPLTSVRLYETGVGYFERSGVLSPSERTGLPVPASHLDDALQSLVVFTPGHSDPIHGVAFGSSLSRGMARAMAGLPAESETSITYQDLLTSLKGAHVELKSRTATYVGRLIDVEPPKDADPAPGGPPGSSRPARASIVVLTDRAELAVVPMDEVKTVRPTDPMYAARLDTALDALSLHSAQSQKMLDVLGAARGPITLGYVAETPVWRTTYRLVIDSVGRAALQGWALVHNDTDEDWDGVKVELVNGRPDSFLFPLAAPRYTRRTLVHPEDALSTVPQLLDKTADASWGDFEDDATGSGGLGISGIGEGGGGTGDGIGLGSLGTLGYGHGAIGSESGVLTVGDLASVPQAAGVEAGALFVYALPERLALRAHASALAPFLQQPVDVESIAWIDQPGQPARAAVRFTNSTTQTLPAGTISIFADGGFAGESALDRLKPGERRFVRFGADLDVTVEALPEKGKPTIDATERLTFAEGTLVEHFLRTTDTMYRFENRGGRPRAIYLTLPLGTNAKVTGADAVDFDAATSTPVAITRIGPRARFEREIVTVEGKASSLGLDGITSERLAKLTAAPQLAATDRTVATEALARQRELEETRHDRTRATEELSAIEKELARLREDAKAVGGEQGAATPTEFAKRLLAAEDRHAAARKHLDDLAGQEKTRKESVRTALAKLGR